MMKTLLKGLVILAASVAFNASAVNTKEPYSMVQEVAAATFDRVTKDQAIIKDNQEHLRVVVEEELLPYIDYKFSALKVLGRYTDNIKNIKDKDARAQEMDKLRTFVDVFKNYLVATYAGVFTQYNGQQVEFEPVQSVGENTYAVVRTTIKDPGKPDIKIAFRVKKGRDGDWRAYDMEAEGISLLDAKKSEIQGLLRTEGLDYVIDMLDKKSKLPVQFRGKSGDEA